MQMVRKANNHPTEYRIACAQVSKTGCDDGRLMGVKSGGPLIPRAGFVVGGCGKAKGTWQLMARSREAPSLRGCVLASIGGGRTRCGKIDDDEFNKANRRGLQYTTTHIGWLVFS